MTKQHYPAIFISDVHLGTVGCQADELNLFLKSVTYDKLYLVGDITDFWALSRRSYFPNSHTKIVRRILKQKEVIYLIGNHDEILRKFLPLKIGNISFFNEYIHETKSGEKFLVLHGDEFDQIIQCAPFLAWAGDIGYTILLRSNFWFNQIRRLLKLPYWSISGAIKRRVKNAVNFIGSYESVVAKEAIRQKVDGVICGHIHHAELREISDTLGTILYANCGDWVESRTAIVENNQGNLELIYWDDIRKKETLDDSDCE